MVSTVRRQAMLTPADRQDWVHGHQMAFRPKNIINFGVPLQVGTIYVQTY